MFETHTKVYSNAVSGIKIVEGRILSEDHTASGKQVVANTNVPSSKRQYIDISWLKGASESYNISSDIRDYVIVPVPIITTDIPNRNMQAWPYSEITYFDPIHGKFIYQTFIGKPTHIDHKNEDPKEARGVILDSELHFVPKYDVGKIVILTAWDRSKDPHLVRQILKKERDSYSMGDFVSSFVDSITGIPYSSDPNKPSSPYQMDPHHPIVRIVEGKLVYMNCFGNTFFEASCFTEETEIKVEGENKTFRWLIDNKPKDYFEVISFDKNTNSFVKGIGHSPRITKEVSILVELVLSDNSIERCTEDHPWMLEEGSYCNANNLKIGNVLKSEVNKSILQSRLITLDIPINVCDITVDTYNNFALASGPIVHNSVGSPADCTAFSDEILSTSI